MANKLEELRVYQEAMAFWKAVNAILDRPSYRRDRKLAEQTSNANDSIPANIGEGFEQPTDAAFVNYLYHAKGSLGEVLARLREAGLKKYLTPEELSQRLAQGTDLSRSLGALIRYLDGCGWKDRGRHKSRLRQQRQSDSQFDNDPVEMREPTSQGRTARHEGPMTRDRGPGTPTRDRGPGTKGPGTV